MFSTVQWILVGVAALLITIAVLVGGFMIYHRGEEITTLNAQLSASNDTIKQTAQTANENAQQAESYKQEMLAAQEALRQKNIRDVELATNLTKLQDEVSNAKPTTCVSPAILSMVDGLRNLQSTNRNGGKSANTKNNNSGGVSIPPPTTPSAADQLIAHWIGALFSHDSTCMNDISQIAKLQGATP